MMRPAGELRQGRGRKWSLETYNPNRESAKLFMTSLDHPG